MLVYT
jgi:hypothetical protein